MWLDLLNFTVAARRRICNHASARSADDEARVWVFVMELLRATQNSCLFAVVREHESLSAKSVLNSLNAIGAGS